MADVECIKVEEINLLKNPQNQNQNVKPVIRRRVDIRMDNDNVVITWEIKDNKIVEISVHKFRYI